MQGSPCVVTSEEVAAYRGMCEAHAARFSRLPMMQADFDDFAQEGLISVWKSLQTGNYPSNHAVENAMRSWARKRGRQVALMSPLEDLDEALGA